MATECLFKDGSLERNRGLGGGRAKEVETSGREKGTEGRKEGAGRDVGYRNFGGGR